MTELTSKIAKELSLLGASKGGQARANVLTAEQRKEIARKAVSARWEKAKAISQTAQVSSAGNVLKTKAEEISI